MESLVEASRVIARFWNWCKDEQELSRVSGGADAQAYAAGAAGRAEAAFEHLPDVVTALECIDGDYDPDLSWDLVSTEDESETEARERGFVSSVVVKRAPWPGEFVELNELAYLSIVEGAVVHLLVDEGGGKTFFAYPGRGRWVGGTFFVQRDLR
jgi:hypothetical protein